MDELEIVQHRQIGGLSLFLNTVDYRTAHFHSEWELILLLDQSLHVTCAQSSFRVEPGQMVLFSPDEPHEFHKTDGSATFLCLQISPDILPVSRNLAVSERLPHAFLPPEDYTALKQDLCGVMQMYLQQGVQYELSCLGQSMLILHRLLTALPVHGLSAEEAAAIRRRNARLKRLIRFVDQNYMHKLRLTDFAREEGCSMHYLSAFIKQTMNQSFQEYVNSVRFNCACKLIAEGGQRMLDVCMESGFSDYRYFSRAFRQQFGMTPEEYSRTAGKRPLESAAVHHSLHSLERFYSREESLAILEKFVSY